MNRPERFQFRVEFIGDGPRADDLLPDVVELDDLRALGVDILALARNAQARDQHLCNQHQHVC